MTIKALLMDFDGTLVSKDMLSEVIGLVGKKEESEQIDQDFQTGKLKGLEGLIARINLLKDVSVEQIQNKVKEDLALIKGARELVHFCNQHRIEIILASGSITPILDVYCDEIGINHTVGSEPQIKDGNIQGISEDDYPKEGHFKVVGIEKILEEYKISKDESVAIGDGRGDLPMFELAAKAIAINPRGGIEEHADKKVDDLHQAREIIQSWMNQ